jgi:tetratricopeptide (TPR) repeat protein
MKYVDIAFDGSTPPKLSYFDKLRLRLSSWLIRRLLAYVPANVDARTRLGNIQLLLGNYAGAERTYHDALTFDPIHVLNYYRRGIALERLGRNKDALQCYKEALSLDPKFKEAAERRQQLQERMAALTQRS